MHGVNIYVCEALTSLHTQQHPPSWPRDAETRNVLRSAAVLWQHFAPRPVICPRHRAVLRQATTSESAPRAAPFYSASRP